MIQEGDVVEKLQTQVQTNQPIYDAYINDDDFIGFHARYPYTRNLTDWMAGDGKDVTDPYFDLNDFLGLQDATGLKDRGFDGKLWQLPDQSFINVYWFRKDWFDRPDLQKQFKDEVRLRSRRAGQLVGLRGHRQLLHQRRQGDRRQGRIRPHGLRQEVA